MTVYGYARVSTDEQETHLQIDALTRAGAQKIYSEKVSAVGNRIQLETLMTSVSEGDSVLVYKLDRLARSLEDLLRIIKHMERAGASLRSLTEPIDTQSLVGRMMVQMLGAVAEFERGLIRERTRAGVRAARERGATLGRPRSVNQETERVIVQLIEERILTYSACAELFGVEMHVVNNAVYRHRKAQRQQKPFRKRNSESFRFS